jgi:hypothetical protein
MGALFQDKFADWPSVGALFQDRFADWPSVVRQLRLSFEDVVMYLIVRLSQATKDVNSKAGESMALRAVNKKRLKKSTEKTWCVS